MSPTWITLSRIKFKIMSGQAVRTAILESTRSFDSELDRKLSVWVQQFPHPLSQLESLTSHQQSLVFILDEGLRGKPIYEALEILEKDVCESLLSEIHEHAAKLPFLSLVPMLFFIGPSFFLLLLGPLLTSLIQELS